MKNSWFWIFVLACFLLFSVIWITVHSPVTTTDRANIYVMSNMPQDSLHLSLEKGSGTYKLRNPKGVKKDKLTWSQFGQDIFVDDLLKQKRNGFFVEIGGYDGESFSNTLLLERERGWTGLLVEANPYSYDILKKKDRNCYMINACISNTTPNMTFILGGALTSANQITSKNHRRRIDADAIRYKNDETWVHAKENVNVKCYSLLSLMTKLKRSRIDYFSLDVEGAEMIILQSIDWKKLDIDLFTIETDQHRNEILQFMKEHNYKWIQKITGDDVFRKIR